MGMARSLAVTYFTMVASDQRGAMLCTNGHNNGDASQFCSTCGVNTFQPGTQSLVVVGPSTPTNGFAIASMVLGIVWVYWIGSVLAIIFGYVALRQIKESRHQGRAMAIAGIVLGWVGVAMFFIWFFVIAALFHTIVHNLPQCHYVANRWVCP